MSHPLGHHRPPFYRKPTKGNFRSTKAWQDYRRTCLAFWGRVCMRCGVTGSGLHIHHLDPVGEGGAVFAPLDRIEVLCPACHRYKHSSPARKELGTTLAYGVTCSWDRTQPGSQYEDNPGLFPLKNRRRLLSLLLGTIALRHSPKCAVGVAVNPHRHEFQVRLTEERRRSRRTDDVRPTSPPPGVGGCGYYSGHRDSYDG